MRMGNPSTVQVVDIIPGSDNIYSVNLFDIIEFSLNVVKSPISWWRGAPAQGRKVEGP